MDYIKENLDYIKKRIQTTTKEDVLLLAVTKTVEIDKINYAIENGITDIAENKPQELVKRYEVLKDKVNYHLIGTLQTNKVKYIIDKVSMIHSLDRISLCEEIQKRAKNKIKCLVQVNISKEDSKHGLLEEEVIPFIIKVSKDYPNIKIMGLMTMAPFFEDNEKTRDVFRDLKKLSVDIKSLNIENVEMKYLSMGMSNDYEIALQEGANIVRIGTAIFGKRNY